MFWIILLAVFFYLFLPRVNRMPQYDNTPLCPPHEWAHNTNGGMFCKKCNGRPGEE